MRRLVIASMALMLSLGAGSSLAAEEPPPYPAGADVSFEPVEPSAWRANEPEWDCGARYPREPFYGGAEVAADGRVWFLDPLRGVRELGSCPIVEPQSTFAARAQVLGPDGTLWLLNEDRLWSWDGADWHVHLQGFNQPGRSSHASGGYSYGIDCDMAPCYSSVVVAPDGTVWLSGSVVSAYDGTEWTDYDQVSSFVRVIGFGPDGVVWLQSGEHVFVLDPSSAVPVDEPTAPPAASSAGGLVESFPSMMMGTPIEVEMWGGLEWVARFDPVMHQDANAIKATEALVAAADAELEDLIIATAMIEPTPGNYASVAAVHIPGMQASGVLEPVIAAMAPQIEVPHITWDRIAGRWVASVTDATTPGAYPVTFYPSGDTAWVLQAGRLLLEAIVAELPEQLGLAAADEEPLAAGTFSPTGPLTESRNMHTATALPDGRVLVIGSGAKEGRFSAEVWDPASASFEPAGRLAKGRKSHTATLLPDGRVLVVGGGRAVAEAEIWDPAAASFAPAGGLVQGRTGHTATLLPDGRVLVVGGWGNPRWLASAELWDPETASFEPTGSLAESRMSHIATALPDGRVLIIGGHGVDNYTADPAGNLLYPSQPRALAEVWDPATGFFSPAGTLEGARSQHTATLLPDGRVLVVGGWGTDGDPALAELWDPETASFEAAGWLIDTRSQHTATLLPRGRVLIVGGIDHRASAEVWDPATAAFIPAGSPARGRSWHTATALPDGRVLIVGGIGRGASSSAEIWEPLALPEEQMRALAEESSVCGELRASFARDNTTGDPQSDTEYLTRCLTCEELQTGIQFGRVADWELGMAVHRERCDPSWPLLPATGQGD